MARKPTDLVPITTEILTRIHAEIKRTGIHPDRLIVSAKSVPTGLGASIPERWFTSVESKPARQTHLDWLFATYAELPTARTARVRPKYSIDGKTKRIPITDTYRETLQREIARTGLSPQMLLKRRQDAPKGVTPTSLSRWLTGTTKTEKPESLNWLTAAYGDQPDAAKPPPQRQRKAKGDRIIITDDHRAEIQIHKRRTGLTWQQIIARLPIEAGTFTAALLSEIANGRTVAIENQMLKSALSTLRGIDDRHCS